MAKIASSLSISSRAERHACLRGNPRDYGGITRISRLFSRVKPRKYRQNTRGRRALTAIRCVNECN